MTSFYDDNFGFWEDMDDIENRAFYMYVQKQSVVKTCVICGRKVKLLPQYDKCNACMERGYDM